MTHEHKAGSPDTTDTHATQTGSGDAVTAPLDSESAVPDAASGVEEVQDSTGMVPVWLAALVMVLLLAVMGMGGYIIRDLMSRPTASSSAELEVERWEAAVEADINDVEAKLQLGFAYQQAERYEDALLEYDNVLLYWPSDSAARYNKGIVLIELDRGKEAEEVLWDVLELEPGHVLAAKALGDYYAEIGQYRSLIEAVRPVVEQQESAADLQYLMGLAYENLGREDWAEQRYILALKYYPDMPEAREALERLGGSQ